MEINEKTIEILRNPMRIHGISLKITRFSTSFRMAKWLGRALRAIGGHEAIGLAPLALQLDPKLAP